MADLAVLRRGLGAAVEVREAGEADAVDGVPARVVARPGTVEGVSAVLREAGRAGLVTVVRGGGTALDWGAPPERVDVLLDMTALDRVVEHVAGDLVVVAEAGISVRALAGAVADAGQELLTDVPADRREAGSTVGGALATGTSGPRRLQRLALRDMLLGATVVLADGTVARSGGKVVKNVAGYDLARMMTGSYGTLAVVVRAALRLHPVRPAHRFVLRTGPVEEVAALGRAVVASQLAPSAVEIDRPAGSEVATVAVLLEGTPDAVATRAARAAELIGGAPGEQPPWWGRLPGGDALAKATATLTGVRMLLETARASEERHGAGVALRGSAMGALHAGITVPGPEELGRVVADLRAAAPTPREGTVVVLRASRELRAGLDAWGPVPGLDLMRSIKEQLDPGRALAPGRFVGGI
ncbi:FAD-binding oxidoreductase [Georgenia sp. SYP-B2076]|uniref:FAD-binding oxidoreductase n=1 Tax=Georgenia sp. SYP-B2076 TaxID=2495881 RepID=UPI000F8CD328|nr:FAD-binding oxidoreductase [Georgenia sp. SYP-B2076]